jgi:hypothetical protein
LALVKFDLGLQSVPKGTDFRDQPWNVLSEAGNEILIGHRRPPEIYVFAVLLNEAAATVEVAAIAALIFVAHRFAAQGAKRLVARISLILVRFEIRQLPIDLHTYFSICSFCKMHAAIDQSVFYSFNGTILPI